MCGGVHFNKWEKETVEYKPDTNLYSEYKHTRPYTNTHTYIRFFAGNSLVLEI